VSLALSKSMLIQSPSCQRTIFEGAEGGLERDI
jgi:hypothetical protein